MTSHSDQDKNLLRASRPRIWEIDFLRGLSILLMVLYHLGYDLTELCGIQRPLGIPFEPDRGVWLILQYSFAGLFIVLSGISSTLSHNNVRRALKLLAVALVITAVTYIYSPSAAIYFGILHFLGIAILIYGLTLERSKALICAGTGAIVLGLSLALRLALKNVEVRFDWLMPFGVYSPLFVSADYFPLLPWLGVFLAGTALGKSAYARKRSLFPSGLPETFINAAGRHSLLIYVLHQPILFGILFALGLMRR